VWFDYHRFFFWVLSVVWFPANDVVYCYTKLYIFIFTVLMPIIKCINFGCIILALPTMLVKIRHYSYGYLRIYRINFPFPSMMVHEDKDWFSTENFPLHSHFFSSTVSSSLFFSPPSSSTFTFLYTLIFFFFSWVSDSLSKWVFSSITFFNIAQSF